MKEVKGNIWTYTGQGKIVIPTNGFVKANGRCVMGRGLAFQAMNRYKEVAEELGGLIKVKGNHVHQLKADLISFPVKHVWWEKADLDLITQSMIELVDYSTEHPELKFFLPRVGCGNGQLQWKDVKPILEIGMIDDRFTVVNL